MSSDTELAELLEGLKRRSGRSYTALAHRTGLSRSTLHRYCLGTTVPGSFGAVERLARVCGASPLELDRLYRIWSRTVQKDPDSATEIAPDPESGTSAADTPAAVSDVVRVRKDRPPPRRAHFWLRAGVLLLVLVVGSVASDPPYSGNGGIASAGIGRRSDATAEQRLEGPLWSVAPRAVPPEYFGLTLNTDTGETPAFPTGAVRLWESGTRWGSIERRPRRYDWSILDRMVEAAEQDRLPVLFTMSGTPLWAARDGRRSGYGDSLASPPDDLADWDRFVEKVATRYRGRIESYELWDYPSHPLHYAGSVATLAEMVERAATIIRRVDPEALVACPSFGGLRSEPGERLLREFARTGAYENCDAAALKMPPRRADGRPEEIIDLARNVQGVLYEEGLGDIDLWNTGPDRDVAVTPPLDARRAQDYAVRFYLAGLYGRHYGIRRMYFYSWGSTGVPLVVQPVGGRPTEAGLRMGRLLESLDGARIAACGQGAQMGLPEGAYTCRFERDGMPLSVYWTTGGSAAVSLDPGEGPYRLRHMDGRTVRARTGGRITFGEEPVLIEHRAA
ncbi:helix-turn-helix domain-containing protein [Streptomyces niveus]|uniref:Helix-turn-helix domain-containing protein n=1 Tax=Streptomyces niveus TaxID=193462 RepID=A0ABZ2A800_STRNV|nr:helix-turn-helix domain-containing protein [Streptomyces niveus]